MKFNDFRNHRNHNALVCNTTTFIKSGLAFHHDVYYQKLKTLT